MIIVKLISGLGNQLFQYTIGRELSLKNNTILKLDNSFFEEQRLRSYKLDHFNINAGIAQIEDVENVLKVYSNNSLKAKVYRKIEKHLPKHYRNLYQESTWWQYEPNLLKAGSNIYLEGYWQHYKYFEKINPLIFDELTIKEKYSGRAKDLFEKIKKNISVSIHIRRTDYITDKDANNLMGVLPLSYYYEAIEFIKNKVSTPTFFIFSDDIEWVAENLKIDDRVVYVDIGEDFMELDLMSKCDHNIIANSSFSWWGAFLNKNQEKTVIGPKNWVAKPEINHRINLLFPSWIKM